MMVVWGSAVPEITKPRFQKWWIKSSDWVKADIRWKHYTFLYLEERVYVVAFKCTKNKSNNSQWSSISLLWSTILTFPWRFVPEDALLGFCFAWFCTWNPYEPRRHEISEGFISGNISNVTSRLLGFWSLWRYDAYYLILKACQKCLDLVTVTKLQLDIG